MLKFKKIELTIDPKYKTADQVLGKLRNFYIISRSIMVLLFFVIIVGLAFLISYVFMDSEN